MRRAFAALALASALLLAACGSTTVRTVTVHQDQTTAPAPVSPTAPPSPVPAPPCTPSDWTMQCALSGQPNLFSAKPLDQTVLAYGIDFGWGGPPVTWLKTHGAVFGASYYSNDGSKDWGAGQVDSYHAAGIATVGVWEATAARALDGFAAGVADARQARAEASAVGEPSNRPIYFAVDFDPTGYGCAICGYFQGADSVLGVAHVGGYGGIGAIQTLFGQHLITYGWQTAAWSGGAWDSRAQLQQYNFLSTLDWDRAVAKDYGQWPYNPVLPVCYSHREAAAKCAAAKHYVTSLQQRLHTTRWQEWWVSNYRRTYGCRPNPPFRLTGCADAYSKANWLAFNAKWLQTQINTTIAHN